jgi:hypothetical protein
MSQISAADNLVIEMETDHWRLFANGEGNRQLLLDVAAGEPLQYIPSFASTRRLPITGRMAVDNVERVVIGWSKKNEAWHLGLILEPELAQSRGSRWCEIAHWPDPDTDVFLDLATEAGQTLARTLTRPFNQIQPQMGAELEPELVELPDLPLEAGLWTAQWADGRHLVSRPATNPEKIPARFELVRSRSWVRSHIVQILWYCLLVIVYVVISAATLTYNLALPNAGTLLPNPHLLPYLGLVTAVVLVGMIVYLFVELFRKPDRIVIDPQERVITALRGQKERWRVVGGDIHSVYVTQVVGKKSQKANIQYGELNLHLGGGEFHHLFSHEELDDYDRAWKAEPAPGEDGITSLSGYEINTDLEAMGLYIARAIGDIPCWYDQRRK